MPLYACVEAGGTKFVCGVGSNPDDLHTTSIPTRSPQETIAAVAAFFRQYGPCTALGIASFGPVDLDPLSPTYGYITATPKLEWRNFNLKGALEAATSLASTPRRVILQTTSPIPLTPPFTTAPLPPHDAALTPPFTAPLPPHDTALTPPSTASPHDPASFPSRDREGAVSHAHHPAGFDTDVNAAALGEARWGAGQGLPDFVYLTIGTGIGGGAVVNGQLVHGLIHPEMGHIRVPRDPTDTYPGACPYHRDCWEGLASGPAIEARWGLPAGQMPPDHPAWALQARYLAYGLNNLLCTLSPKRFLLGGGVMHQTHLFPLVRAELQRLLSGYIVAPELEASIGHYIVPPGLGARAGVLGAMVLAERAAAA